MPKITVYKRNPAKADTELCKVRRAQSNNFLKYWRVVRYWALRKYGISVEKLEVLLYLYDIPLFTRSDFKRFEGLLTWDKNRMNDYIEEGYIGVWRDHVGYKKQAKMYELTTKSKRICNEVYKKLTQEAAIPETKQNNPIFVGNGYADRMYRKLIIQMNKVREENK